MSQNERLACAFFSLLVVVLNTPLGLAADAVKIGGTGSAMGTMRLLGEAFRRERPQVEVVPVPGLGSGGGRKALMGGALDVAVIARPMMSPEEIAGATTYLFGWSPFVLAVASATDVANLSVKEIVDIYNGNKTHWPDGRRLRLILRPMADSDTQMLSHISSSMAQAVKGAHRRQGMIMAITDEESADAIQSIPGAIGTSMISLIVSEKRPLKAVAIDGLVPGVKSVADGTYPWLKSFYLATRADASPSARSFVEFVLSAQGRVLLTTLGFRVAEARKAP